MLPPSQLHLGACRRSAQPLFDKVSRVRLGLCQVPLQHVQGAGTCRLQGKQATRLNAEAAALASRRQPANGRHVNVLACVELERGLRAGHFEVHLTLWVVRLNERRQRAVACVQGDCAGRFVDDEAVVNVGLFSTQCEGLATGDTLAESRGTACRNATVINGEVLVGRKRDLGALDCRSARQVEVGVVCQVDGGLVGAADELGLVVDSQDVDLFAVLLLHTCSVGDNGLDRAWVSLVAILAEQRELHALATLEAVNAGNGAHADGLGTVPLPLAPALVAAVEVVDAVVGGQCVGLAAVEGVNLGVLDAVGDAADGLAEERNSKGASVMLSKTQAERQRGSRIEIGDTAPADIRHCATLTGAGT
ncbi:hypothetical protein HYQ46_007327 [Verticillium longisporum]|nr:hypothetical protein HYQ46_007327 [Verticillium longisporum]